MTRLSDPPLPDVPTRPKILCVDDERSILNVMERGLTDHFEVLTAASGEEGLEILRSNRDVIVIVSDQKMHGMLGNDFLHASQSICPDSIRIIVSAYSDVDLVMDSINKGQIYKFLLKPFDMEDFRVTLVRATEHYFHKRAYEIAYRDLKDTQEQLLRSEKMSVLGKLMSGVAHELGNPISNINHGCTLVKYCWTDVRDFVEKAAVAKTVGELESLQKLALEKSLLHTLKDVDGILKTLETSSSMAADIIKDLRGFSRLDDAEWTQVDLNEKVERAVMLVKTKYKHHVTFHVEANKIPKLKGLSGPLTQVLVNLITNAAQAADRHGDVWVSTSFKDSHVVLTVRDNGKGISEDHLEKIFDVGFTTKSEEEGTGLGLAICHRIISKHNGVITVSSRPSKGTEFVISLPV